MNKKALQRQEPCCDQHKLDKEIRELMISIEKQNALLSGYYTKLTKDAGPRGGKMLLRARYAFSKRDK